MTEPTLKKYFQDDPPSPFDQINGKCMKECLKIAFNCSKQQLIKFKQKHPRN